MCMELAVQVAAAVIGLTDSRLPGMDSRLGAFFAYDIPAFKWEPRALYGFLRNQLQVAQFYWLDVRPAIQARRRAARDDLISHLLERGYEDGEILRVEPVLGHLYRRATADIQLESDGELVTIRAGNLIDIHIYAINADQSITGKDPLAICPGRSLRGSE